MRATVPKSQREQSTPGVSLHLTYNLQRLVNTYKSSTFLKALITFAPDLQDFVPYTYTLLITLPPIPIQIKP